MNGRVSALYRIGLALLLIVAVLVAAALAGDVGVRADFMNRLSAPSWLHPFGTDQMGRDMLARSLHGLALSLWVGLLAASLSVLISTLVALTSALGERADRVATFITDAMLSMPHLMLLILLSFAMGGGTSAVILAVAISHWPRLARVLRVELREVQAATYVEASYALGKSRLFIAWSHILPHLAPHILVGALLMFPHAILHEAGLTFLGFGLEPSRPAIGVMLSDSMRHISAGRWWLALFPGLMLMVLVLAFEALGSASRRLLTPREAQC
ncbi:ABC transporter permease [Marinomonas ostreistagni]|uniref:ABC transporter permease n=1 Tax=Marinomonas ostreistagni TaxID=359209 RepID=UPI00195169F8|nr:ABC transporter permease [Marinomonas ostreistagni]MBM6549777.1 ABC transporter permease [Marinomonas ostreistagni]